MAHPAGRVEAFLEAERQRHIQQGTKSEINVANAYTEVLKLSLIQGCPVFTAAEVTLMHYSVKTAKHDSIQIELSADPDRHKKKAHRAVLTDADIDGLLRVCAQHGDRLSAARFQVILLVGCACGMIRQSWYHLIKDVPS